MQQAFVFSRHFAPNTKLPHADEYRRKQIHNKSPVRLTDCRFRALAFQPWDQFGFEAAGANVEHGIAGLTAVGAGNALFKLHDGGGMLKVISCPVFIPVGCRAADITGQFLKHLLFVFKDEYGLHVFHVDIPIANQ
jgi:hypothetical protein